MVEDGGGGGRKQAEQAGDEQNGAKFGGAVGSLRV
jgi:hypothetical protein